MEEGAEALHERAARASPHLQRFCSKHRETGETGCCYLAKTSQVCPRVLQCPGFGREVLAPPGVCGGFPDWPHAQADGGTHAMKFQS